MGRDCKFNDTSARRYIRIEQEHLWEMIRELSQVGRYTKSFNAIINDALMLGLPELKKRVFEKLQLDEVEEAQAKKDFELEYAFAIIRLMKEMIANEIVIKSVVCSLFNERVLELNNTSIGKQLEGGTFKDTPEYLVEVEARLLKEANRV